MEEDHHTIDIDLKDMKKEGKKDKKEKEKDKEDKVKEKEAVSVVKQSPPSSPGHRHSHRRKGQRKEFHYKLYKTPKELYTAMEVAGENKTKMEWDRIVVLGFLAGVYIAFGGMAAHVVSAAVSDAFKASPNPLLARIAGAAVFPFGLMLVAIAGGELFTGNTMYITFALCAKKTTVKPWLKNWVLSYLSNFVGSVAVAFFLVYLTDLFELDPVHSYAKAVSIKKCELGWGVALLRGIGCNMMVCISLMLSMASEDTIGKIFGIWWPIFGFVLMGFEHSVANMFYIPLGMMLGNHQEFGLFLGKNLIPVTIGNIIGGAGISLLYRYVYLNETTLSSLPLLSKWKKTPTKE